MADLGEQLSNCDREPIHLIGTIQSHGTLLVAEHESRRITHASANVEDTTGWRTDDILGKTLSSVFGDRESRMLADRALAPPSPDLLKPWPCTLTKPGGDEMDLSCVAHSHDGRIYLELYPGRLAGLDDQDLGTLRQRMIDDLRKPDTLEESCAAAVRMIRLLTGYDRVLCYRFHEDLHGEVIAEETDSDERYLGLHYPASDIPAPARRHFELNQIRLIGDVDAEPVPIVAAGDETEELDLTYASLRGVAPVHLHYLRAMGVRASMSISLVIEGKLWGLIACHHETPHVLPASLLHTCELAGQMIAIFIEGQQNAQRLQRLIKAQELAFAIGRRAQDDEDFIERLKPFVRHMAEMFGADSVMTKVDGQWTPLHQWQSDEVDFSPLIERLDDGMMIADRLSDYLSIAEEQREELAGGVYLSMAEGDEDYLFLGRREYRHSVTWAGEPEKPKPSASDGAPVIEPRSSFAKWQQEVRGRSRPYLASDRETLAIVLQALRASLGAYRQRRMTAVQAELAAMQTELRVQLLNGARLASMGELAAALAHELNQPLTAVSNFVNACRQMLRGDDITVPAELVELMDDAVDESQRAGEIVHRLRRFIQQGDLERVALDIALTVSEAARLAITTKKDAPVELVTTITDDLPLVHADPIQIEQVVFNLVRNAIDAMAASERKVLTLKAAESGKTAVEITIDDSGPGIPDDLLPKVFEPFQSSKDKGMGIGLSLCRSIIEAHGGRIVCGNTGEGARFSFTLPVINEDDVS